MERLTWFDKQGVAKREINCRKCSTAGKCKGAADCKNTAVNRLASIEDILGDTYDLGRLLELVEADKAGRCVVLPFNVGDYVWVTMAYGKEYNPPIKGVLQKFVLHNDEIVYLEAIILMDIGCGNIEYGYSEKSFGKCVYASLDAAKAALAKEANDGK